MSGHLTAKKLLSSFQKIASNPEVRKVLKNITWLLFDKGIRLGLGFFVGAWVIRYLGTERFGMMTYAYSFTTLFGAAATLGMERIIIAELVRKPEQTNEILGSAFALRVIGSLVAMFLAIVAMAILEAEESTPTVFTAIFSLTFLFQSLDVIEQKFQSSLYAKRIVVAKNSAYLLASAFRVIAILAHADTMVFVILSTLEISLGCIFLWWTYQRTEGTIFRWKPSLAKMKQYFWESLPLLLSYLSYLIYSRIDAVMLKNMLSDTKQVGLYGASLKLFDIPMSIYTMIVVSFYPKLTEIFEKKNAYFLENIAQLTAYTTLLSYAGLIFCLLLGEWAILLVFGEAYRGTYPIFLCHLIGVVFVYNGAFRTTFLTLSGKNHLILYNSIFSALLNVVLNYWLIPIYKGLGAALATALTQLMSFFVFNLFFPETRVLFKVQLQNFIAFSLWKPYVKQYVTK